MYNVCWRRGFSKTDAVLRVALYDVLHDMAKQRAEQALQATPPQHSIHDRLHRGVDALSGCRGRHQDYHAYENGRVKQTFMDAAVTQYSQYKFVIAGENAIFPGYVTEKILNALLANTIPIYIGAPDIFEVVNPERIIRCEIPAAGIALLRETNRMKWESDETGDSQARDRVAWVRQTESLNLHIEACAARVLEVDSDDAKYLRMVSQPALFNNTVNGGVWSFEYHGERIRQALALYGSDLL